MSPQSLDFLERMGAPIVATNLDGMTLYWSAEAQQLLGFSPDEIKFRNWWEHLPATTREQIEGAFASTKPGATFAAACAIRHKQGHAVPVVLHVSVLLDQKQAPQALLTVFHKIVGLPQDLAPGAAAAMNTAEGQVREAVYQARKTQAIGALAAGLAHDFNNILTAVLSHLDLLLLEPSFSGQLREHALHAKTSAARAAELVSRLLAFSRQSRPTLGPVQLSSLFGEAVVLLRRRMEPNIELRSHVQSGDIWMIKADANHMMHLITNLCLNARDAMPDGGILSFKLANVLFSEKEMAPRRAGEFVRLTVSDTGKPVPPHVLARLFEPDAATREFAKGTGLGLTIASSIASEHGGWMEVESENGTGSHFHAYFPRLCHGKVEHEAAREVLAANDQSLEGKETILLVDDEEMVRLVARTVLGYRGYTIVEATNGEEALEKLAETPDRYDLVVLDLNMPKMDGWAMLKRLRETRSTVPVIVLSGDVTDEFAIRVSEAGAVGVLPKPFDNLELLRKIRWTLDTARSRK